MDFQCLSLGICFACEKGEFISLCLIFFMILWSVFFVKSLIFKVVKHSWSSIRTCIKVQIVIMSISCFAQNEGEMHKVLYELNR